jgi:ABC-type transporter Mla subunit MlaD
MDTREIMQILSGILMAAGAGALIALIVLLLDLRHKLGDALVSLKSTLTDAQGVVGNLQQVTQQVLASGILDSAKTTMASVSAGVDKIDPVLGQLQSTLTDARELLDDATQTSQSVRARVDDLAAMQRELQDTSAALADTMTQLRDQQIAGKLANVLSDTSTLMADVGLLVESAHAVLEGGRPLVENIGEVVESARNGVKRLTGAIGSFKEGVKEGVKAGVEELAHPSGDGQR